MEGPIRKITHIDMDAFYASAERTILLSRVDQWRSAI
jgi:nucleotidyltransferase/DNA polymerase involved in DNA repair